MLTAELEYYAILPMITLALTTLFTPGPNNALLANSGANFGFLRSMPHILGVAWGFVFMTALIGVFLREAFDKYPWLEPVLQLSGFALLLYISFKIATSGGLGAKSAEPRPFTFLEASFFQWVNPKAWTMALAISSQFMTDGASYVTLAVVCLVFGLMGMLSATSWTVLGVGISGWLSHGNRRKIFNLVTAALLALCALYLLLGR